MELGRLDATAQAELVRERKVSPLELVDAAIARIEKCNPQLNAVIRPRFERAREEAQAENLPDGPFRGVPFLLKDLVCAYRGEEIHGGNRALKQAHFRAPVDTYLAERFRAAGLICLGQTNTPEFGFMTTTEPECYGPSRNPWNPEHSTGGSSGGSGAAVAARMVPMAHANDGGGSIRIPASACGLVGLKPSRGRNSLGPDYGEAWGGFIAEGVVSVSVRDTAAILDATAGLRAGDPYTAPPCEGTFLEASRRAPGSLRIGLMTQRPGGAALDSECVRAAEATAELLKDLGHQVEIAHPAAFDEDWPAHFVGVFLANAARTAETIAEAIGRPVGPDDFERYTWHVMEQGRKLPATSYIASLEWLERWQRRMASWWEEGFDLLLNATLGMPPPAIGHLASAAGDPELVLSRVLDFIPYTPAANASGQPAVSLPLHWSEAGLPVGVQLTAAYGREDILLSVASQLEEAASWHERCPEVAAD